MWVVGGCGVDHPPPSFPDPLTSGSTPHQAFSCSPGPVKGGLRKVVYQEVVGRQRFDPTSWLAASAAAMRMQPMVAAPHPICGFKAAVTRQTLKQRDIEPFFLLQVPRNHQIQVFIWPYAWFGCNRWLEKASLCARIMIDLFVIFLKVISEMLPNTWSAEI